MSKGLLLGLLAVLAAGLAYPTDADPTTPLQQARAGVSTGEIQCKPSMILVESPAKRSACLYEETVTVLEKRGWHMLQSASVGGITGTDPIPHVGPLDDTLDDTFEEKLVTITSPPLPAAESSFVGTVFSADYDPYCKSHQDAISIQVPNRVRVGELFNVTASFSFDNSDPDKEREWDDRCRKAYQTDITVVYPPNYQASGDIFKSNESIAVHDHYMPHFTTHIRGTSHIEFNQPPMTFQMRIIDLEDAEYRDSRFVYTFQNVRKPYDQDALTKDNMWDYHSFTVNRFFTNVSATVYTQISDGYVYMSDTEFPSGDSKKDDPVSNEGHTSTMNHRDSHPNQTSDDVPFEWIAEEIEEGPYAGYSAEALVFGLGLNQTYLDEFLKIYPEYKDGINPFNFTESEIRPQAFGEARPPNIISVNGRVMAADPGGNMVPDVLMSLMS